VPGILPDRYANPRPIGRGGMGAIYLAEDRDLGREVAVKVLDDRFGATSTSVSASSGRH
jgi:eukaryotic-like serine/threonine-protein kinase